MNDIFGIRNTTDIDTGISKMVKWAKTIEMKESKPFTNIEITKNLPPSWISK